MCPAEAGGGLGLLGTGDDVDAFQLPDGGRVEGVEGKSADLGRLGTDIVGAPAAFPVQAAAVLGGLAVECSGGDGGGGCVGSTAALAGGAAPGQDGREEPLGAGEHPLGLDVVDPLQVRQTPARLRHGAGAEGSRAARSVRPELATQTRGDGGSATVTGTRVEVDLADGVEASPAGPGGGGEERRRRGGLGAGGGRLFGDESTAGRSHRA